MKKNDIWIFAGCLLLFFISIFFSSGQSHEGEYVYVHVNKELYGKYWLKEDSSTKIVGEDGHSLYLNIKDNAAYVSDSTCPDKTCESSSIISKTNQSIICLPAKIVISIESNDASKIDSISR